MALNLEHEDLLIKLRAKLNEEKIKLWEPPYRNGENNELALKELASKYAKAINADEGTVFGGLVELQMHSVDRLKANEEFKETGCATFRIKVSMAGKPPKLIKISKKLSVLGEELISSICDNLSVDKNRVKLIYNGKVVKTNDSLQSQGIQNGAQMMALIMIESPEQSKKKNDIYAVMKATLDDATLLSEQDNDLDDDYMKLEDQSGAALSLPAVEQRSLMIGLALHGRGRSAAANSEYSLALVLLLEADRQFSECRSSILDSVDNWAGLQLDIAWCYLCLQNLSSAGDAAARLARADAAFKASYGENFERVIALKGNSVNERILCTRLYLLQGIVAYHQNKRAEAIVLLQKAEKELNSLRVDPELVSHLMELGWSESQARWGLRVAGNCDGAHECLTEMRAKKQKRRDQHRNEREQRALGLCADGSLVNLSAVKIMLGMGFRKPLAVVALRSANNNVTDAIRIINEHQETLGCNGLSESDTSITDLVEPDESHVAQLLSLGYRQDLVCEALRITNNNVSAAVDRLVQWSVGLTQHETNNPSTSAECSSAHKKLKKEKLKKKQDRDAALNRLKAALNATEDEYFGCALAEEEQFLVQYKSLI